MDGYFELDHIWDSMLLTFCVMLLPAGEHGDRFLRGCGGRRGERSGRGDVLG